MANKILQEIKDLGFTHDEVLSILKEKKSKDDKSPPLMKEEEEAKKKKLEEESQEEEKEKKKKSKEEEKKEKKEDDKKTKDEKIDIGELTNTIIGAVKKEVKAQLKMKRSEPPSGKSTDKTSDNQLTRHMFETVK